MKLEKIINNFLEGPDGEAFGKAIFAGIADITVRSMVYRAFPEKEDTEINSLTMNDFLTEAFSETDMLVLNEFKIEIAAQIKRRFFSLIKTIADNIDYGEKEKSFKIINENSNFVKSFTNHMVFCLGDIGLIFSHEYFLVPFIGSLQELVASSVISETDYKRHLFSPLNVAEISWRLEKGERGSIFVIVTRREVSEFVGPPRKRARSIKLSVKMPTGEKSSN